MVRATWTGRNNRKEITLRNHNCSTLAKIWFTTNNALLSFICLISPLHLTCSVPSISTELTHTKLISTQSTTHSTAHSRTVQATTTFKCTYWTPRHFYFEHEHTHTQPGLSNGLKLSPQRSTTCWASNYYPSEADRINNCISFYLSDFKSTRTHAHRCPDE